MLDVFMLHSVMRYEELIAVPGDSDGGTDVHLGARRFVTLVYHFELD